MQYMFLRHGYAKLVDNNSFTLLTPGMASMVLAGMFHPVMDKQLVDECFWPMECFRGDDKQRCCRIRKLNIKLEAFGIEFIYDKYRHGYRMEIRHGQTPDPAGTGIKKEMPGNIGSGMHGSAMSQLPASMFRHRQAVGSC